MNYFWFWVGIHSIPIAVDQLDYVANPATSCKDIEQNYENANSGKPSFMTSSHHISPLDKTTLDCSGCQVLEKLVNQAVK